MTTIPNSAQNATANAPNDPYAGSRSLGAPLGPRRDWANPSATPRGSFAPSRPEQSAPPAVLVYGPDRRSVNFLLYVLADESGRDYRWLDLHAAGATQASQDQFPNGWIEAHRIEVVPGTDREDAGAVPSEAAFDRIISVDESEEVRARLRDFLMLPESIQLALSRTSTAPGVEAPIVSIANFDLVAGASPADALARLVRAAQWSDRPVLVGFVGRAPVAVDGFSDVLCVDRDASATWATRHDGQVQTIEILESPESTPSLASEELLVEPSEGIA